MQLTELSRDGALDMLERIFSTLYPGGNLNAEWHSDTLDSVAQVFHDYEIERPRTAEPSMVTDRG